MDRRDFLSSAAMLAAASGMAAPAQAKRASGSVVSDLKGPFLDLSTPRGCREAWARLAANTDMKSTKYGWYTGIVQGVRPGEAIRDLVGFTGFSCAKLIPNDGEDPGYKKILREIGFYTDLKTGEILEEWTNPYLGEKVKVVPIANDPFNHTITDFYPPPPSYGGLNAAKAPKIPMKLDFRRHNNRLNWWSPHQPVLPHRAAADEVAARKRASVQSGDRDLPVPDRLARHAKQEEDLGRIQRHLDPDHAVAAVDADGPDAGALRLPVLHGRL
jgi:hypothetical protein